MSGRQLSLLRVNPPARPERPAAAFHVRAHMRVDEVEAGECRARTQQAEILTCFQSHAGERFTPSEVWRALDQRWPLTSVRRAITDLADHGDLSHHPHDRRPGLYGALEGTWSAAE